MNPPALRNRFKRKHMTPSHVSIVGEQLCVRLAKLSGGVAIIKVAYRLRSGLKNE